MLNSVVSCSHSRNVVSRVAACISPSQLPAVCILKIRIILLPFQSGSLHFSFSVTCCLHIEDRIILLLFQMCGFQSGSLHIKNRNYPAPIPDVVSRVPACISPSKLPALCLLKTVLMDLGPPQNICSDPIAYLLKMQLFHFPCCVKCSGKTRFATDS